MEKKIIKMIEKWEEGIIVSVTHVKWNFIEVDDVIYYIIFKNLYAEGDYPRINKKLTYLSLKGRGWVEICFVLVPFMNLQSLAQIGKKKDFLKAKI